MRTGAKLFEEVFASEIEENGDVDLYEIEYIDGVTCYDDDLDYNSGSYNYHKVSFRYEGNKYGIEYRKHTSENVSDTECYYNTFQMISPELDCHLDIAIDKLITRIETHSVDTMEEIVEGLEDIRRLI